jgi:hypothetical protein
LCETPLCYSRNSTVQQDHSASPVACTTVMPRPPSGSEGRQLARKAGGSTSSTTALQPAAAAAAAAWEYCQRLNSAVGMTAVHTAVLRRSGMARHCWLCSRAAQHAGDGTGHIRDREAATRTQAGHGHSDAQQHQPPGEARGTQLIMTCNCRSKQGHNKDHQTASIRTQLTAPGRG